MFEKAIGWTAREASGIAIAVASDMTQVWLYSLGSVVLVSLISFVGITTLLISESKLKQIVFVLVSMAVGALFGDAFIHLLPDAYRQANKQMSASVLVLVGIFAFFILEKFLLWRHDHILGDQAPIHPVGYMNLVADGLHNFMDGVLIGASYLSGRSVGIATTVAVILHEVPQELGDFGVLLHAGFTKTRALWLNFFSALLAILGAGAALLVGAKLQGFSDHMIPIAAGGFIYIAGCDLLPELQRERSPSKSLIQLLAMGLGVGLMLALLWFD